MVIPVTGAGTSRVRPSPAGRPHGRPIDRRVRTTPVPAPITLVTSQKFVAGQLVAAGRRPENKYMYVPYVLLLLLLFLFRQMASTRITTNSQIKTYLLEQYSKRTIHSLRMGA